MSAFRKCAFHGMLLLLLLPFTAVAQQPAEKYREQFNALKARIESADVSVISGIDSLKAHARGTEDRELELAAVYLEALHAKNSKRYRILDNCVKQGIELGEEIGNYSYRNEFDFFASFVLHSKGKFREEEDLLWEMIRRAGNDTEELARIYNRLANFYNLQENYARAASAYQKAITYFTRLSDTAGLAQIETNIAINYFGMQRIDSALYFFRRALNYNIRTRNRTGIIKGNLNLGEAFLQLRKPDSAFFYLKSLSGIPLITAHNEAHYLSLMQDYFDQVGRIDSAYAYAVKRENVLHIADRADNRRLNDEFEYLYRQREKDVRNAEDREKMEREKNEEQTVLFVLISCAGLLFLILMSVFIAYRVQKRNNRVLLAQKEAIVHKNKLIDASLREKEVLLKEIHHRVKNNLQIISSLLNLQSKSVNDPNALAAIAEGRERIFAIALIHQKLYQDSNFAILHFREYLQDLLENLKQTYVKSDQEISFEIHAPELDLNMDTAVPLGLIICELVTNSLKHGFRLAASGEVHISIEPGEGAYQLDYRDDGVGLATGMDFPQEGSLGAEIILALTEQLEGTIESKKTARGVHFYMEFKQI